MAPRADAQSSSSMSAGQPVALPVLQPILETAPEPEQQVKLSSSGDTAGTTGAAGLSLSWRAPVPGGAWSFAKNGERDDDSEDWEVAPDYYQGSDNDSDDDMWSLWEWRFGA